MRENLLGEWLHSHEESKGDRLVFHSPSFSFPPSRGRQRLTLASDGVATAQYPGPTDKRAYRSGSWEFSGKTLKLNAAPWIGEYELETISPESLVLRKIN